MNMFICIFLSYRYVAKVFSQNGYLKDQMKMFILYISLLQVCGKGFSLNGYLKDHLKKMSMLYISVLQV